MTLAVEQHEQQQSLDLETLNGMFAELTLTFPITSVQRDVRAIASISTPTSFGSFAAWTVERAGRWSPKWRP